MNVTELKNHCIQLIMEGKGDARVYTFTDEPNDSDVNSIELNSVEVRGLEPYKPFWSTVEGYIIQ